MTRGLSNDETFEEKFHRKSLVILSLISIAFFFIINDLIGWAEGGGIFSILGAIQAVRERLRVVDIDGHGLRTVFVIACFLPVTGMSMVLNIDLPKRLAALVFFLLAGGGFLLDGIYDGPIMRTFMASRGYIRCEAGDWAQGNGKSRVWFDDYVREGAQCRPRIATVPEKSLFN